MATDAQQAELAVAAVTPTVLPQAARHRIFLYLGALIFLLAFGSPSGGLIDIPKALALLRRANYTGLLALEIDYLHPSYAGEETAIAQSLSYLRETLDVGTASSSAAATDRAEAGL